MSAEGMGPSVAVEGATTATVFETYIERVVGPTLRRPGRLVVMDNLGAHEGERVKELTEGKGCELLYLPSYSPDLDPIEEAFSPVLSKSKASCASAERAEGRLWWKRWVWPSRRGNRSRDTLGLLEHCGYRRSVQPLRKLLYDAGRIVALYQLES
jgi:transposase